MEFSLMSHPHFKNNKLINEILEQIPKEKFCNNIKRNLKKILLSRKTFDDEMINMLLISPRPGLHHLLIDEVNEFM